MVLYDPGKFESASTNPWSWDIFLTSPVTEQQQQQQKNTKAKIKDLHSKYTYCRCVSCLSVENRRCVTLSTESQSEKSCVTQARYTLGGIGIPSVRWISVFSKTDGIDINNYTMYSLRHKVNTGRVHISAVEIYSLDKHSVNPFDFLSAWRRKFRRTGMHLQRMERTRGRSFPTHLFPDCIDCYDKKHIHNWLLSIWPFYVYSNHLEHYISEELVV